MLAKRSGRARFALRPSHTILILTLLEVACFFVFSTGRAGAWARDWLALSPARVATRPWTLVTYALLHTGIGALLSTALGLWFFGTPVIEQVGTRRTLAVLAAATVLGGLTQAALGLVIAPRAFLVGGAPMSLAMIAAFGVAWGATPITLFGVQQMRASTCAILFLGLSGLLYLLAFDVIGFAGGAVGAAVGAAALMHTRLASWRDLRARWRRWRIRRRYRVIPGGRDSRRYIH
jgi:rhomboid family protein